MRATGADARTALLALTIAVAAGVEGRSEAGSGPVSLLPTEAVWTFASEFPRHRDARLDVVRAVGVPFTRALRVTTLRRPEKPYSIQLSARTVGPVRRGDRLVARFFARSASFWFSSAYAEFVFERAGGDYSKSGVFPIEANYRWSRFDLPFLAKDDYAAGRAQINFRLGFDPQVIEIGGVEVLRYPPGARVPVSVAEGLSYEGRSPSAPWRAEAAARIERHRKADLEVEVRGPGGAPVSGAMVRARLLRHEFGFGTAVSARFLEGLPDSPNKSRYREEVVRLFNRAVIDNALKWSQWDHQKGWAQKTVAWLRGAGIEVRGHNLVWPGWSHLPPNLRSLERDPRHLKRAVEAHIHEEAGLLRGQIAEWDVVNEPMGNQDLQAVLGKDSVADWLGWARAADGSAKLFVNEAGVLTRSGQDKTLQDAFEALLRRLLKRGAPLDGIGLEAHFDSRLTPPARLYDILDRYAKLGKPIEITEFDIDFPDETLKADYLRDFMTVCFSHPAVDGIVIWEFWAGLVSGNPEAALLFDKDWKLKASGKAWKELVFEKWRTDEQGRSDALGRWRARGFRGEYEIVVRPPKGREATLRARLPLGGAKVFVDLDAKGGLIR